MNDVVIADYLRTAQSRSRPSDPGRDAFHQLRGDDLLARLIPAILKRTAVDSGHIDDLLVGSALGVSEQWTFGGRNQVLLANANTRIPARFIDQQCGSGMAAIQIGFMEIATGFADTVLACGMEHMTRVPMGPSLFKSGVMSINPALYEDAAYSHWDMETIMNMGLTAEKLSQNAGISRHDMDTWAVRSHERATRAIHSDFFAGEILPITTTDADGTEIHIDTDQAVRAETNLESTANLKAAFRRDGTITAGNASPLSAGAGAMLLMSCAAAEKCEIEPLAFIRSIGFVGVDPTIMGHGPVPASLMALEKAGLQPGDIDFWEINEAFSVVALHCINELGIDPERVNIHGGGIALGHPLGATGIRLTGTLARVLQQQKGRYGCATACVGGGQGVAVIVERCS